MCKSCVKILIDPKDNRNWQDQKLDWSLKKKEDIEYEYWYYNSSLGDIIKIEKSKIEPEVINKCICGILIGRSYYVYNNERQICCIMGSVCICRYKKNDTNERGAFIGNQNIENQMVELNRYHCDICDKTISNDRITKHNDSPTHKKNYKIKNFRMCKVCKQYKIEKIKPAYYHTCSQCYKATPRFKLPKFKM